MCYMTHYFAYEIRSLICDPCFRRGVRIDKLFHFNSRITSYREGSTSLMVFRRVETLVFSTRAMRYLHSYFIIRLPEGHIFYCGDLVVLSK